MGDGGGLFHFQVEDKISIYLIDQYLLTQERGWGLFTFSGDIVQLIAVILFKGYSDCFMFG